MSKKSLVIVGVLLVLISALVVLIVYSSNQRNINNGTWRADKQPIIDRFPNLINFDKCFWKAGTAGENGRFSAPGPTSYWMKGFLILNKSDFDNLKTQYKWDEVNIGWQPSLDTNILKVKSFKWAYSETFNKNIKSSSYVGNFYLDLENGIIFFDIQK